MTEGKYGQIGRLGKFLTYEDRYVWDDQQHTAVAECVLYGRFRATDGVEASFIGYPRIISPDGSSHVPGTQYGMIDGKTRARVGYYKPADGLIHPIEPWRLVVDRGDQYPPSGTGVPPVCS